MIPKYEELPTGKRIIRQFNELGDLTSEMHVYGALDIALKIEFTGGATSGETFFVKQRLASRTRYEKAREQFSDMPPADTSLEDTCDKLLKAVSRERRNAAQKHRPDPERAQQIDAFCIAMIDRGQTGDAAHWVQSSLHTLGERSHASSKKLVAKLLQLGCARIHACEIDSYEKGQENSGQLVVELPTDVKERKAVFRELNRHAGSEGLSGDFDDGQRYVFVKLD